HAVNYWVGGIQVKPGEVTRGNRKMVAPSIIYGQGIRDNSSLYQLTHAVARYSCKVGGPACAQAGKVAGHLAATFSVRNSLNSCVLMQNSKVGGQLVHTAEVENSTPRADTNAQYGKYAKSG